MGIKTFDTKKTNKDKGLFDLKIVGASYLRSFLSNNMEAKNIIVVNFFGINIFKHN